ncbi:MAG: AAA family ATPase [Polyangiaceae bacterium]|nr:AAA family ATPase [Polyangiaceae bacterium]
MSNSELLFFARWLSHILYQQYKTYVLILIDEYDTPIQAGYTHGYFDEIVPFIRNLLSAALKDNVALFKGVLTGILYVLRDNMFSGLNNIRVHSMMSSQYATSFGFTEDEVAAIVEPAHVEEVRAWYNGYIFGGPSSTTRGRF